MDTKIEEIKKYRNSESQNKNYFERLELSFEKFEIKKLAINDVFINILILVRFKYIQFTKEKLPFFNIQQLIYVCYTKISRFQNKSQVMQSRGFNPIPTGHGQNQPIYERHVTKSGRNRVKEP